MPSRSRFEYRRSGTIGNRHRGRKRRKKRNKNCDSLSINTLTKNYTLKYNFSLNKHSVFETHWSAITRESQCVNYLFVLSMHVLG